MQGTNVLDQRKRSWNPTLFPLFVQEEKKLKDVRKFSLEDSKPGIIASSFSHKEIKVQVWSLGWKGSIVCTVIHRSHFFLEIPGTKYLILPPTNLWTRESLQIFLHILVGHLIYSSVKLKPKTMRWNNNIFRNKDHSHARVYHT